MKGRAALIFWLRFFRRFAVGTLLLYAAVALTLGGTPAARPTWYALTMAWLVALCALRRRALATTLVEVTVTNIALTLLLAEGVLQLHATVAGGSLIAADLDGYRLAPGHDYGDGLIGNKRGYPGPELPAKKRAGIVRIAALGDSFAVGPAVPFADNYLTRLAVELPGVEVGNFGVSGAGPREYRQILDTNVWSVQPDLVLVSIFVGNDVTETLPRPRHLDPHQHALFRLGERGWRLLREAGRSSTEPPTAAGSRVGAAPLSERTFHEVEARRLAVCLKEAPGGMEKRWHAALAELDQIVRSCRRRDVPLAFVLIPDEFQINDAVLAAACAGAGVQPSQLDLAGPQRRLAAFFAERGVPCLDLLPTLRAVPCTYAPCDTHWNVAGNHLAAQQIAAWLRGWARGKRSKL